MRKYRTYRRWAVVILTAVCIVGSSSYSVSAAPLSEESVIDDTALMDETGQEDEKEILSSEGVNQETEASGPNGSGSESETEETVEPKDSEDSAETVHSEEETETVDPLSVAAEAPAVTISTPDPDKGTFSITVTGVNLNAGERIIIPVWQDGKQQDIRWNTAVKSGNSYIVEESAALHGFRTGTYHVHVYKRSSSGAMTFLTGSSAVIVPSAEVLDTEVSETEITAVLSEVKTYDSVTSVKAAFWSKVNGQDDISWETAVKQADGSWKVSSLLSRHSGTGTYYVHVYAFTKTGGAILLKAVETTVEEVKLQVKDFQASVDGTAFTLSTGAITAPVSIRSVVIAVWSGSSQSNIAWYTAAKNGSGYQVSSTTAKHKNLTGTYHAHLYIKGTDGSMTFGAAINFTVEEQAADTVSVSDLDPEAGSFRIHVTTADTANISHLQVAVWSPPGQNNIKWYKISDHSGNSWTTLMEAKNHRYQSGTYQIHVYAVLKDGSMKFLTNTTAALDLANQVAAEKLSDSSIEITIYNPMQNGQTASSVLFPTWSSTGGQDDLIWYRGVKQTDGSYSVIIDQADHLHDGTFFTHIYVTAAGSQELVQALDYTLAAARAVELNNQTLAVMRNIIYAVETGGQVYGGHRYDCFTEAYKNSAAETAITIGAGAWFGNNAKLLLNRIREEYPKVFAANDTAGIAEDLDNENWKYYGTDGNGTKTILTGSDKAEAIQAIISSPEGIAVQDTLINEMILQYTEEAESLGVTDVKARLFCANIRHLGGYNPMVRVINYCKSDGEALTMENLWTNMREREAGSGNYVGSDLYASRHRKVMEWLETYL
ncbi:MAG: GBS Bsp-like repeat-containing protein [Lachnospiraceae bacterium]|nr:GBS Bsp-like repeat-containing protein [Lachnospiraceae bacterium]